MHNVKLLVGTRKGAFIYKTDETRHAWLVDGPLMGGWAIYHMVGDTRGDRLRLYAAANHAVWGPAIAKSDDGGQTWDQRSEGLGFPADSDLTISTTWHVAPGHAHELGVVYAGTAPAGLFRSEDWGRSWRDVPGITRHPFRRFWSNVPGDAPPLHSILIDPRDPSHMYVSLSGGGSYVTTDGGERWHMFSHHAIAQRAGARIFISQTASNVPPGWDPASVSDVHAMRLDEKQPDRLWAQAHSGVFRSDDGGRSFSDVTAGLPSFHGFPIAVTKRAPDVVYVVPLEVGTDNLRVCDGQFAVHRTLDGGETWERCTAGLPGPLDFQSAYREALHTDGLEPEGVYVGTSNGQVYSSLDGGEHWERLPGTLPPVLSLASIVA